MFGRFETVLAAGWVQGGKHVRSLYRTRGPLAPGVRAYTGISETTIRRLKFSGIATLSPLHQWVFFGLTS